MIIYSNQESKKYNLIDVLIKAFLYALVLLLATKIFKGFYISSLWQAVLASLIIMLLNATIKPFLKILTLPITLVSLGIFYPFINVIILKLTSLFMGNDFILEGWLVPFFISIFISIMNIVVDVFITRKVVSTK